MHQSHWAVLLLLSPVAAAPRDDIQTYLESVYSAVSSSDWDAFSDDELFSFYDNLTFYFENNPTWATHWPSGRAPSHPYASSECDCLHIQLKDCKDPTQKSCPYWPVTTFLNMDFIERTTSGFPSNVWFEGGTFPGEWAFPESCIDSSLGGDIYGWHQHLWLYPITGFGLWFNTGQTSASATKVGWLLENGVGSHLGDNTTAVMDHLANTVCPGYRTKTSCVQCSDPSDPSKCCCHGSGDNLGIQVVDIKSRHGYSSWEDALAAVAKLYTTGALGQGGTGTYPDGTFFNIRNLLDNYLFELGGDKFDTLQFYREPQHSDSVHSFTSPPYAFEALLLNSASTWSEFCSSKALGVVSPVGHLDTYAKGYIDGSSVRSVQPVSSWKPRPEWDALFKTSVVE